MNLAKHIPKQKARVAILSLTLIIILQIVVLMRMDYLVYPEIFIYPYLTEIGLVPYKDIADQHFPGLFFLPINFASLGINTIEKVRIFHYSLLAINHIVIFYLVYDKAKKLLPAVMSSVLYAFLYIVFDGHIFWIDNILTTLFLLNILFLYLFDKFKKPYLLIVAGVPIGFAILMKQTSVLLFCLGVIYLLAKKQSVKDILLYCLGPVIALLYLYYFLISRDIVNEFVRWTVIFNLESYGDLASKTPSLRKALVALGVFGALPFILWRKRKSLFIVYLVLFSLFTITYAFPRFEMFHLKPAIAIAVITFGFYYFDKLGKILFSIIFIVALVLSFVTYRGHTGKVYYRSNEDLTVQIALLELTERGDTLLSLASTPHMNFLTSTRPPDDFYFVHLPWYLVLIEDELLESIQKDPPNVVLKSKVATLDGVDTYEYMPDVVNYISENYELLGETENNEIWGLNKMSTSTQTDQSE